MNVASFFCVKMIYTDKKNLAKRSPGLQVDKEG